MNVGDAGNVMNVGDAGNVMNVGDAVPKPLPKGFYPFGIPFIGLALFCESGQSVRKVDSAERRVPRIIATDNKIPKRFL